MVLKIGNVYKDKSLGRLLYLGRFGYDFTPSDRKGVKGAHIFINLEWAKPAFIWLYKKQIADLQP